LFTEALAKINIAMAAYESRGAKVDDWTIKFQFGVHYESLKFDKIWNLHRELEQASKKVDKTRLLLFFEHGRLYDSLKYSEKFRGKWRANCETMSVCARTADRYIDFFHITKAYPRLLICELSFESIMSLYSELSHYLEDKENEQFRLRLTEPLCTTTINQRKSKIESENLPQGGDPPQRLLCQSSEWDATWELADNIMQKQSKLTDDD